MPEGPTLVGFKQRLQHFAGQPIEESAGYNHPCPDAVTHQTLVSIETFGKNLIFQLKDFFLNIHFGLFGSFLLNERKKVNAALSFRIGEDEINFYVVKVRREEGSFRSFYDLRLDPFHPEFSMEHVLNLVLAQPRKRIGEVLMDQTIFPGLGNILRNEVLFLSGIHPESAIEDIPHAKLNSLLMEYANFTRASVELIDKGIWKSSAAVYKKQSADISMYIDPKLKRKTFVHASQINFSTLNNNSKTKTT